MNVSEFAARYNKMPHLIGDFPTPKARMVKHVVESLEARGWVHSPSGLTADIAAKWLIYTGQPLSVYRHAQLRVWVVRRITDEEIERMVT